MTFTIQWSSLLWILCVSFIHCQIRNSSILVKDSPDSPVKGLFPSAFNLATGAIITVNATCGETGPEVSCKLGEANYERLGTSAPHCDVCDAASADPSKRHQITNAIDGTNSWWQSPTLANGRKFEWVTVILNLKQPYQITYVTIKSAISPLPGNWILERSVDGQVYKPWQYFAVSDTECWEAYKLRPTIGKVRYRSDDEVICTSFYSKTDSNENGEIHTSTLNGRPGADGPSDTLREFTKAQFIRIRMQKIKTSNPDLMAADPEKLDKTLTRKYFYTLKDISIGGQCLCNGHAKECRVPTQGSLLSKCICEHNTCGNNCDKCCGLFNQKPWRAGTSDDGAPCESCQCFGHADECYYDQMVADKRLSLNLLGKYEGGGVCLKCKHYTTGINCDQCKDGYYRPKGVSINDENPCHRCDCHRGPGVSDLCIKDDTHLIEGLHPGDCFCKKGFTGKKCDACDNGYRKYPTCEECTCVYAGILNTEAATACDGPCNCKKSVIGTRCDKCQPAYYNLASNNPEGCSQCYCFGATNKCKSSDWGIEVFQNMNDWLITDLSGRHKIPPVRENGHISIANDDIPSSVENYYWQAPSHYLGQKLYSYGTDLKFIIRYVVSRGDVSGYYTDEPDIILEGGPDNLRIGLIWHTPGTETDVNKTMIIPLREQRWFKVTDEGKKSDNYVTREEFTLILYDMRRLLIRAKFHTDQIEGGLYQVDIERASNISKSIKKAIGTEKCDCPEGYSGLSCETCSIGYRRVNNILVNGICEKCNCNNHAESCDPFTGKCSECLHNTTGSDCGECLPGLYGNARLGFEDDCKPCACPLTIPSNFFASGCQTDEESRYGYSCFCQEGYTGERCDRCADGWFGNPLVPGGSCSKCDCPNSDKSKPGWCDHLTGQCHHCLGNTGGWKCTECLPYHYGNPSIKDCKPCNCNPEGSESLECHPITGQCQCKPNFTGLKCDKCAPGFGNLERGCQACNCSLIGSLSPYCDEATGKCPCRPGVFGQHCEQCLDGHYGFSERGCLECNCNPLGSMNPKCNELTGQCECLPYVMGRDCGKCEPGYWNIASGKGCEPCNCNFTGSLSQVCDEVYGQCDCKPGVGGKQCDRCLPGYYGYSSSGCNKCDLCTTKNHICDPKSGKCVCPPNTAGPTCQDCAPGTWGHDVLAGCSPCECNLQGSVSNECDHKTGNCLCLEGFEGRHCDKCQFGYYRFPNCRRCDCYEPGTLPEHCNMDGLCQCDESGQCPCRVNVDGRRCDRCKENAFALSAENPSGCVECFCMEKTSKCEQSQMVWSKVSIPPREVMIEVGMTDLKTVQGFRVIPENVTKVGVRYVVDQPLYWALPKEALGDKVTSYNGYLHFKIYSRSGSRFPESMLHRFPLIILQGNHRLVLHHNAPDQSHTFSTTGAYQVKIHESEWIQAQNPQFPVTRKILMVALQRVQYILIRAFEGADVKIARLTDVHFDVGAPIGAILSAAPQSLSAIGVEQCKCPSQYTESSCQDPNEGYYRKFKPNYLDSKDPIDLVGYAEVCPCYNYSRACDKETGACVNCIGFTTGPYCNLCIKGYYGDPPKGIPCRPCACPILQKSVAETCELVVGSPTHDYVCNCPPQYAGPHCEECADGYWGNPLAMGECVLCVCNPIGSISNTCDKTTGQCPCKEGITGRECTQCLPRHVLTDEGCINCNDECTGLLLDDVEFLQVLLKEANLTDVANLPWIRLMHLTNRMTKIKTNVHEYQILIAQGKNIMNNFTLNFDLETLADILYLKARDLVTRGPQIAREAQITHEQAQILLDDINDLWELIMDAINQLKRYGIDATDIGHPTDRMLMEAERILRELQARDFTLRVEEAERELRKARNLLERVLAIGGVGPTGDLKERLDRLARLLSDIISLVQQRVQKPTQTALRLVQESFPIKRFIIEAVENSTVHANIANETLIEARRLLELSKTQLIEAAVTYDILPRLLAEMDNLTNIVEEKRSILARLNPEYAEKYVSPCERHAIELMRQAQFLSGMFNATRDVAEYALQAAQVYQKIIDALAAAERAAKDAYEAAERAYKSAYPGTSEALIDRARKAKQRSEELLEQARDLRDRKVPELEKDLAKKRYRIDEINEEIFIGRRNIDLINRALDGLPKDLTGTLREVDGRLRNILDGLEQTHRRIDEIDRRADMELRPRLNQLKAGTTSGLENLTKIIEKARNDIREAARRADRAEEIADRVNRAHNQLQLNLKDLKDKILLARQKAASIRVSLGNDRSGICMRSYEPDISPSVSNHIVLNYGIKEEARDALLFFIGSKRADDFMAIEMIDRKIRYLWNAGGGTKILIHSLNIETNDQQLLKDNQWYKIEVNRIGNFATLTVKRIPDGNKADPFETTDTTPQGFNRMDLNRDSYFYIGGLPPDFRAPRELRSRSFAGCLYEAILDGKQVGLWNFTSNKGCDGCKEGATEPKDPSTFQFKGEDSYAILDQIKRYDKKKYLLSFQFKTFDEDALLFFTSNPVTQDFVSIFLKDGHVNYQFNMGTSARLTLTTRNKYNTGQWVRLAADREKLEGILTVEEEYLEGQVPTGSPSALELQDSDLYFGGVTPNFTAQYWPSVVFKPFLGCIKDAQVDTTPLNLLRMEAYGVDTGCREKVLKVVSFKGTGYLELNSEALREEADFSFTFKTTQPDALLLLSTFEGKGAPRNKDSHYYSVSVVGRTLEARFNGGAGETILSSETIVVNDGAYHTVTISKKMRKISLSLDDKEIGATRLARGTKDVDAPSKGGLYLGGLPPGTPLKGMAGTKDALKGVIRDAVFNGKLLGLNDPNNFEGVGIGRESDAFYSTNGYDLSGERMESMPAELMASCAEPIQYSIESKAVKIGDAPYSHITLNRERREFARDFSITFEFRTYYPNGMIFLIRGSNKRYKFHFALTLKGGKLVVDLSEKKRLELISNNKEPLNDGKWHSVSITKEGKTFWLKVDHAKLVETSKVRRRMPLRSPLYVGGIPEGLNGIDDKITRESFKGCIKNFNINKQYVDLASGMLHNVSQCFSNIEKGAYFAGEGFAIFDEHFNLGYKTDIELEFKTTRLNGILLSLSNGSDFAAPSLSIELHEGKVYAAVDIGDGPLRAIKSFDSRFDMCDGKWHTLKVQYAKSSVTLKIDRHEAVYGLSEKEKRRLDPTTSSPLYIGGLPDFASNSVLHQRDHFVGCLRNVAVNDMRKDWISDIKLHSVLPNSCPT